MTSALRRSHAGFSHPPRGRSFEPREPSRSRPILGTLHLSYQFVSFVSSSRQIVIVLVQPNVAGSSGLECMSWPDSGLRSLLGGIAMAV